MRTVIVSTHYDMVAADCAKNNQLQLLSKGFTRKSREGFVMFRVFPPASTSALCLALKYAGGLTKVWYSRISTGLRMNLKNSHREGHQRPFCGIGSRQI